MIFARFDCQDAEGIVLAHTLALANRTLKKGRTLTAEDIDDIQNAGILYVTGAKLEAGDVDENQAAIAVATALAGSNLRIGKPTTGRCNLYALKHGLVTIDRACIDAINLLDGDIAVATLPLDSEAEEQQVVASIKVIPFAVSGQLLKQCCALAYGEGGNGKGAAISLNPFQLHRVALILTETPGLKPSLLDATRKVTQQRLQSYGSTIVLEQRCAHTIDAVSRALQSALASDCELILICGATITVDCGDVIPSAIVRQGGEIEHFGMPVEPGNMLLLARHGSRAIINLPGCSRSPKLNGLDWVLQRTLAGIPVSQRDIMLMGVGGLIKHIPYTSPRRNVQTLPSVDIHPLPRICAI